MDRLHSMSLFLMSLLPILLCLAVVSAAAGALYSTLKTVNAANLLGRAIIAHWVLQYSASAAIDLLASLGAALGMMHHTVTTGYGPVPRHIRLLLCCALYILSAVATTIVLAVAAPVRQLLRRIARLISGLYMMLHAFAT